MLLLDQERARWDQLLIGRGLAALERTELLGGALGPYALQAAIAACHARARTPEDTNWGRIVALYDALAQLAPSPVVDLNRAVALAMAFGPAAGLEAVDALTTEGSLRDYHPCRACAATCSPSSTAPTRPVRSSSARSCRVTSTAWRFRSPSAVRRSMCARESSRRSSRLGRLRHDHLPVRTLVLLWPQFL